MHPIAAIVSSTAIPPNIGNPLPSGKLTERWKITIFNGKIHYKWAMFNSYVKLPEGKSLALYWNCIFVHLFFQFYIAFPLKKLLRCIPITKNVSLVFFSNPPVMKHGVRFPSYKPPSFNVVPNQTCLISRSSPMTSPLWLRKLTLIPLAKPYETLWNHHCSWFHQHKLTIFQTLDRHLLPQTA